MSTLATEIANAIREAKQALAASHPWDNAVLAPTTAALLAKELEHLVYRPLAGMIERPRMKEYAGLQIFEDRNMPVNRMALRLGSKVVAIVDLDRDDVAEAEQLLRS